MKNYYECKLKSSRIDENGRERRVTESFLVHAVSFTDAEARMVKYAEEHSMRDVAVVGIAESKIDWICREDNSCISYKARIATFLIDDECGKEKRIRSMWLVFADDFDAALAWVNKAIDELLVGSQVESITLCNICEVIDED